ncbi:hypothetical protein F1D05_15975 [Kribbella qitaiheensis]|uniref:Uncharacterized protein n=1 Tax=Kribbella qitaiheensis TaxID=1544730 RepID=A0A7G6WYS3_9ACTN|nr:hypothetical protein [Kribbella qitaiheensis]QNE19138.1 hypothetical protein F1D05_15975 [Kribbella qitaiheensis]
MSWQLWVLVATAVAGGVGFFVLKLRHAEEIFNQIVGQTAGSTDPRADEVGRRRLERESNRRGAFTHLPHIAGHRRHH